MEKIILSAIADRKLEKLLFKLHDIKYFGDETLASKYVKLIFKFIYSIPTQTYRLTRNPKYGHFYCTYKPNSRTSYFITFDRQGDLYLIKTFSTTTQQIIPNILEE